MGFGGAVVAVWAVAEVEGGAGVVALGAGVVALGAGAVVLGAGALEVGDADVVVGASGNCWVSVGGVWPVPVAPRAGAGEALVAASRAQKVTQVAQPTDGNPL